MLDVVMESCELLYSIAFNYKSWIVYLLCSWIICDFNVLIGCICFIYSYFACYLGHSLMHTEFFYCNLYSISHNHHHLNSEWFGFILNCLTEYLTLTNNIVTKYVAQQFGFGNLFFINEWVIFLMYFMYTSVHNINYSILRVNNYHVKHHENVYSNIGPDFYDSIFHTKNEDTPLHESTDHYIPNTLVAFVIVLLLKNIFLWNPEACKYIFAISWFLFNCFVFISSAYIFKCQIDDLFAKEMMRFFEL